MVTFRNNNNVRRGNFRRNDRNFKSNGERQKYNSNFSNTDNFKRKAPGRNNHNAPKLIEKYNDLAREALSNGDKILSENYLQHADHFTRILNEKEKIKKERYLDNKSDNNFSNSEEATLENDAVSSSEKKVVDNSKEESLTKTDSKSPVEII